MKLLKNNWFLCTMILGIVLGCLVGFFWDGATALEPLGTVFTNLMFCVVVPMVFCSISSAIANMKSAKKAGKVMGITVASFVITCLIAAVLMYILVLIIPVYTAEPAFEQKTEIGSIKVSDLIVNFLPSPTLGNCGAGRPFCP